MRLKRKKRVTAQNVGKPELLKLVPLIYQEKIWQEHWQGMPEYVNENVDPVRSLVVRFLSAIDFNDFCAKIGQELTGRTKSIWYPRRFKIQHDASRRYVDES